MRTFRLGFYLSVGAPVLPPTAPLSALSLPPPPPSPRPPFSLVRPFPPRTRLDLVRSRTQATHTRIPTPWRRYGETAYIPRRTAMTPSVSLLPPLRLLSPFDAPSTRLTSTSFALLAVVLLLSSPHRGHRCSANPTHPRPAGSSSFYALPAHVRRACFASFAPAHAPSHGRAYFVPRRPLYAPRRFLSRAVLAHAEPEVGTP